MDDPEPRGGTHLLHSQADPAAHLGRLKPDIIIRSPSGALEAIIDAKYKRLRSWRGSPTGVDRGDLYQLTSYLSGHEVPLGALAYPPHETDEAAAEQHGPWLTRAGQHAVFARLPATASATARATEALVVGEDRPGSRAATAPPSGSG